MRETLIVFLLILASASRASDAFDTMNTRFSGTAAPLRGAAFGAGVYVAVGDGGTILSSTDTITWIPRISRTTNRLNAVRFGASGFVAVGEGALGSQSTILNSSDGVHWVTCTSPVTNALNAVCHLSGRYVAVGNAGIIVTSTNGLDWASISTGAPYNLNGVDGATIYFVAVGDSGTILTSPDGLAWTARFSGIFARLTAISIFPAPQTPTFVAVGESGTVATSSDSVTWTVQTSGTASDLYAVASDTYGRFGAVGKDGVCVIAMNGVAWTPEPSGTTNNLRGLLNANGNFLAVGDAGAVQAGIALLPRNSGLSQLLSGVCYGNGTFVAVGAQGAIVTSSDGADWISRDSGSTSNLNAVCYGSNTFVAVGEGTILTSIDGTHWTRQSTGATNIILGVAYGNGVYAAVAHIPMGFVFSLKSVDGVNWTGPYLLPQNGLFWAITFGAGVFVAVSNSGSIASSSDGMTWTGRNSGVSYALDGVAFGNDTFVAVGWYTTVSPDGTNWTAITSGGGNSITYGEEGFVAPAILFPSSIPVISTSLDGITWSRLGVEGGISSVTFGHGIYVGLGGAGIILQSTPVEAQAQPLLGGSLTSNGFQISITSEPGYNYTLQSSPTLVSPDWTNVYIFTGTQVVTSFLDSTASNRSACFYRLTSP